MKTLLLMRHAKSSWKEPELADHERPLNKRGKLNAPRMGRLLREQELTPDLIVSSTARRARQTADAVADLSGYQGELRLEDELYAAPAETCLEVLQALPDDAPDCVMLVGHNPGLEELLELLTGDMPALPTGAIAQVALPIERWRDLTADVEGRLLNLWSPKELP
jgi:phosphohistidine phosphatase